MFREHRRDASDAAGNDVNASNANIENTIPPSGKKLGLLLRVDELNGKAAGPCNKSQHHQPHRPGRIKQMQASVYKTLAKRFVRTQR